jgi:hypothetical protein
MTYFYCDYAQPKSLLASTIFASFIRQLFLCLERLKKPCPSKIQEQLVQAYKDGQEKLSEGILEDILVDLTASFVEAFIFIDGLDECEQSDIKEILKFTRRLCTSLRLSKIFIASRKEVDVQSSIPSCIEVEVTGTKHIEDIARYIEQTVNDQNAEKGLVSDPGLVKDIKDKLICGAENMYALLLQVIRLLSIADSLGSYGSNFKSHRYLTIVTRKLRYPSSLMISRKISTRPICAA